MQSVPERQPIVGPDGEPIPCGDFLHADLEAILGEPDPFGSTERWCFCGFAESDHAEQAGAEAER